MQNSPYRAFLYYEVLIFSSFFFKLLLTSLDPSPDEDDIAASPFTPKPDYVSRRFSLSLVALSRI